MGDLKLEDMSLPALFEQARKIHMAASESAVDQVRSRPRDRVSWLLFVYRGFVLDFVLLSFGGEGYSEEGGPGFAKMRGYDR